MFAEGTGLTTYNALDEFLFFGGLGSGGLSNVTWRYYWYYNASDPANSSEGAAYTNSTSSPSARTNMSLGTYQAKGVALLYGGLTNTVSQRTANDSWIYNYTADTWTNVTRRNETGVAGPPAREEAAFAVDQKDGLALLFGGIAPEFTSHGSTGSVIWQDTWVFSFRTDRWTQVFPANVPPGRFGASMVWDAKDDEFLMVEGCALACMTDAWAFSPLTQQWTNISETGSIPSARASASFEWDPGSSVAILYGGMSHDSAGNVIAYNDTYTFLPGGQWSTLRPNEIGPAPIYRAPPMYDAQSTWANFPGCNAMFISGGNPALSSVTEFVYDIVPTNDTPPIQCWSIYDVPQPPSYIPPPCSHATGLVVTVVSSYLLTPIPNAIVAVNGTCGTVIADTDSRGMVSITIATPDNLSLAVSAAGFHDNSTWYNYTYTNVTLEQDGGYVIQYDTVWLVPFPRLHVQVFGNDGGIFLYPISDAVVSLDNSSIVGYTNANGWANASAVSVFNRTATVTATGDNYSTAWKFIFLPYTGEADTYLTLLEAGTLTVRVLDAKSGQPIASAHGVITRLDPGLPAPISFVTSPAGTFARHLISGNYSALAWATGYLNRTAVSGYIPWVSNLTLTVELVPDRGTNASVQLLDAATDRPIAGGTVTFGSAQIVRTNARGWANATDLLPPGPMRIFGSAAGYRENSTTVELRYNYVLPPVVIKLQCLDCITAASGGSVLPVSPFLPQGGAGLLLLLIAPALLVVGGAIYAVTLSGRRRPAEGAGRPRPGRAPTVRARESP
jgi:hypothetical protein